MKMVKCKRCGKIGYSAYAKVQCACGGGCKPASKLTITREEGSVENAYFFEKILRLFKKSQRAPAI